MSAEPQQAFSKKTVTWIALISVGSFVVALVMAAFGDPLSRPRTVDANSFSYSALGHRALAEFLEQLDLSVEIKRTPFTADIGEDVPLLVAEPGLAFSPEVAGLEEALELASVWAAPFILVLPKWLGIPGARNNVVERVLLVERDRFDYVLDPFVKDVAYRKANVVRRLRDRQQGECESAWGQRYRVELDWPQFLVLPEVYTPLVQCEGFTLIATLQASEESAELLLISDPDLINNHGILRGEHARLVRDLLTVHMKASGIVIDETTHGFTRHASLLAELLRFPLVLAVLNGVALAALVVWAGAGRFGSPTSVTPRFADGKRVLIDNSAQLLNLGRHSAGTLRAYFHQTLRAVGAHYFFAADTSLDTLANSLQTISDARGFDMDLQSIRDQIEIATRQRGGRRERAVRLAGRLHCWRQEMTDGTSSDS